MQRNIEAKTMPYRTLTYALILLLTACVGQKQIVRVPQVVEKQILVYRPLPDELKQPCQITYAEEKSVDEAVRVANQNTWYLEICKKRLDKIINLQP